MLLIDSISKDLSPWIAALRERIGAKEVVTWQEVGDLNEVDMAVVWNHRPTLLQKLPHLKLVSSLGAGVDHIVRDPNLGDSVMVSKVVSDHLSIPMSNFCIGAVIYFQRQFDKYARDKENKVWDPEFNPEVPVEIGILGLGTLGQDLARKLSMLGFSVHGLSRSKKIIEGIQTYGEGELDDFLKEVNMLICMLPATESTKGMINKQLLQKMKKGSYLINVGRGVQQVDADILESLDSGQLKGAFLDVFPKEPLGPESLMWNHPKVFVTPHIAVVTKIEAAAPQIAENYKRLKEGKPLLNLIDRERGY